MLNDGFRFWRGRTTGGSKATAQESTLNPCRKEREREVNAIGSISCAQRFRLTVSLSDVTETIIMT